MNHICQHERQLELLGEWAGDRLLLVPVYFFWAPGNPLQKSVNGLLRSLLHQILTECKELANFIEVKLPRLEIIRMHDLKF